MTTEKKSTFYSDKPVAFKIAQKIEVCKRDLLESAIPYQIKGVRIHPNTYKDLREDLQSFVIPYGNEVEFMGCKLIIDPTMEEYNVQMVIDRDEN